MLQTFVLHGTERVRFIDIEKEFEYPKHCNLRPNRQTGSPNSLSRKMKF